MPIQTESDETQRREWILEAETEYRFELDPKSLLAITVRSVLVAISCPQPLT